MFYIHGAGRSGKAAWPHQPCTDAVFANHSQAESAEQKATIVASQAPAAPYVAVAHSLGAVATGLAIQAGALHPTHLVLLEPALYDAARGDAAIEEHIATMTRARARASAADLYGYWQIVRPLMFNADATREDWAEDEPLARQFATLDPPWGHGLNAESVVAVPTFIVTGGWNAEYEAIGGALTAAGATSIVLTGNRHRIQDHPDFNALLTDLI